MKTKVKAAIENKEAGQTKANAAIEAREAGQKAKKEVRLNAVR